MTDEIFKQLLEDRITRIRETLEQKKAEYAKTGRMHNFERAAEILRTTPEKALMGIAIKHVVSVLDLVDGIHPLGLVPPECWNEKMGDAINYFMLLDVMVRGKGK